MNKKNLLFLLLSLCAFVFEIKTKASEHDWEYRKKSKYKTHDPFIWSTLIKILESDYPNIHSVRRILKYYPMIARKDKQAQLLLLCLQKDHLEILSLFLSSGAMENVPVNGYILLHTAIVNGINVIGVEWLLRAGALQGDKIIYLSLLKLLEKKYAKYRLKNDLQVYSLLKREIAAK